MHIGWSCWIDFFSSSCKGPYLAEESLFFPSILPNPGMKMWWPQLGYICCGYRITDSAAIASCSVCSWLVSSSRALGRLPTFYLELCYLPGAFFHENASFISQQTPGQFLHLYKNSQLKPWHLFWCEIPGPYLSNCSKLSDSHQDCKEQDHSVQSPMLRIFPQFVPANHKSSLYMSILVSYLCRWERSYQGDSTASSTHLVS